MCKHSDEVDVLAEDFSEPQIEKEFFLFSEKMPTRGDILESHDGEGNQYLKVEGGVISLQNLNYYKDGDPTYAKIPYKKVGTFWVRRSTTPFTNTLEEMIEKDAENASLTSASL